jgi:hypothetical protein
MTRAFLLVPVGILVLLLRGGAQSGPPASPPAPAASGPQSAKAVTVTDGQWRCRFLLRSVALPRDGRGNMSFAGDLKNESGTLLRFQQPSANLSALFDLSFWAVGTPYVYRLQQDPVVSVDYTLSEVEIAPGGISRIRHAVELGSNNAEPPLYWFERERTDGFGLKKDGGRISRLPPGLYGVSDAVEIMVIDSKVPITSEEILRVESQNIESQNMLWIEVRPDGTALPVTTRPAW